MTTTSTLVVLYCIATAVAIAVRRLRIPYIVALVVVGLSLGSFHVIAPPNLTRDLPFTFFLPGLLFEAAFHLDLAAFARVWKSAMFLAVPGVVIAMTIADLALVGFSQGFGLPAGIDVQTGLVFAAVVAATDPVAVPALFRELKVPAPLAALVETESLLNDGTGVGILSLILAFVTGASSSLWLAVVRFGLVSRGGLLVGWIIGWVVSRIVHRLDDPLIEIGLTVIAACGSFVVADGVGTMPPDERHPNRLRENWSRKDM